MPADHPALLHPFTPAEIEATVASLFCQGVAVPEIRAKVRADFHVELSREEPWRILSRLASRGRLQYVPGIADELATATRRLYPRVHGCRVVETSNLTDVAVEAARYLLQMVQSHCERDPGKREYHIGFAGGRCLRQLAREFARLLSQPEPLPHLPEKITFHAMVGGFTDRNTETDPNFFYPYFVVPTMQVKQTEHVALYAPGLLTGAQIRKLRKIDLKLVNDAWREKPLVDTIITSAGHWYDDHSTLRTLLGGHEPSIRQLEQAGTIGDMCWQPFGPGGPVDLSNDNDVYQAMVLFKLKELPEFIAQGKHVLLVLGPCGRCNQPKTTILRAILEYRDPLITQLVVDSRTARGLIFGPEEPRRDGRD